MPTREEIHAAQTLYDEAVAMYEAAAEEFAALEKVITEALRGGRKPSDADLKEETRLRAKVSIARYQVSRRVLTIMRPPPGGLPEQ
jgi:hypothetical protein